MTPSDSNPKRPSNRGEGARYEERKDPSRFSPRSDISTRGTDIFTDTDTGNYDRRPFFDESRRESIARQSSFHRDGRSVDDGSLVHQDQYSDEHRREPIATRQPSFYGNRRSADGGQLVQGNQYFVEPRHEPIATRQSSSHRDGWLLDGRPLVQGGQYLSDTRPEPIATRKSSSHGDGWPLDGRPLVHRGPYSPSPIPKASRKPTRPDTLSTTRANSHTISFSSPKHDAHRDSTSVPQHPPRPENLPSEASYKVAAFPGPSLPDQVGPADLNEDFVPVLNPRRYFTKGRVFRMVWVSNAGPSTKDAENTTQVRFGQTAYTEIMRFVVLFKKDDCCICAPIHTFNSRGADKQVSNREDYALVFSPDESGDWDRSRLSRSEIPIIVEGQNAKIDYPTARIQFGKPYTVEYYRSMRVHTIGYVHKEAIELLSQHFHTAMKLSLDVEEQHEVPTDTGSTHAISANAEYSKHPAHDFEFGKLFRVRWYEPDSRQDKVPFSRMRTFLVVKEPEFQSTAYCLCLSVSTYGGKATLKRGVNAKEHALIWTHSRLTTPPNQLAGENINNAPIQVISSTEKDSLSALSRLDYGKIYTVECNLSVKFIGAVADSSIPDLCKDFDARINRLRKDNSDPSGGSQRGTIEDLLARLDTELPLRHSRGPSLPCNNLRARNPHFFARQEILSRMQKVLIDSPSTVGVSSVALWGILGGGKTEISLQYAHDNLSHFEAIFWLPSESEESICTEMGYIARDVLRLDDAEKLNDQQNSTNLMRWLRTTTSKWLLIFDEVETSTAIDRYWPVAQHGAVILNTRHAETARYFTQETAEIDSLDIGCGTQLLVHCVYGIPLVECAPEERQAAENLAKKVGGLPVALSSIAARMTSYHYSFEQCLATYEAEESGFRKKVLSTLSTVLRSAFEGLADDARSLLRCLCFMDPDVIPRTLFQCPKGKLLGRASSRLKKAVELSTSESDSDSPAQLQRRSYSPPPRRAALAVATEPARYTIDNSRDTLISRRRSEFDLNKERYSRETPYFPRDTHHTSERSDTPDPERHKFRPLRFLVDPFQLDTLLGDLAEDAFIKLNTLPAYVSIHRLIQDEVLEASSIPEKCASFYDAVLILRVHFRPPQSMSEDDWLARMKLIPHVLSLIKRYEKSRNDWANALHGKFVNLLRDVCRLLVDNQALQDLDQIVRSSFIAFELDKGGPKDAMHAFLLFFYGLSMLKEGDFTKASSIHEECLAIRYSILSPTDKELVYSCNYLGAALGSGNSLQRGFDMLHRADSILHKLDPNPESICVENVMVDFSLSKHHYWMEDFETAHDLLARTLRAAQKIGSTGWEARVNISFVTLYCGWGKFDEAEKHLGTIEVLIETRAKIWRDHALDGLYAYCTGKLRYYQGNYLDSIAEFHKAIENYERSCMGLGHQARTYFALSCAYKESGHSQDASVYLTKAQECREHAPKIPSTVYEDTFPSYDLLVSILDR